MVGLGHTLICDVLGASNLIGTIIYLWVKNSSQILANSSTRTLSLHSLRLSDAGEYTCRVTVRSPYLRKEITAMTSHSLVLDRK